MLHRLTKIYEGDLVSRVTAGLLFIPIDIEGTIVEVSIESLHSFGTAVYTARLNGVVLWSGGDRISIAAGGNGIGTKTGLEIAVEPNDDFHIDLVEKPTSNVPSPIVVTVVIDDGVEFQPQLNPVSVADEAARFALTDKAKGDLVKQLDTGETYVVIDPDELDNAGGYLLIAAPSSNPGGGGGVDKQVFSTPGTAYWTKPAGAKWVEVLLWGAGGGGGGGSRASQTSFGASRGGRGGGGGGFREATFDADSIDNTVSVTVGAGGIGGAGTSTDATFGSDGSAGGQSSFGTYVYAGGGGGGTGGNTGSPVYGGGGGGSGFAPNGINGQTNVVGNGGGPRVSTGSVVITPVLGYAGSDSPGNAQTSIRQAEFGGGAGGNVITNANSKHGGQSMRGGGGGGAGGCTTATNSITSPPGGGGASGVWVIESSTPLGGTAGVGSIDANTVSGGNGGNGANGTGRIGGAGGGGGGSCCSTTASTNGGNGGNGGNPGGGGGGGGHRNHGATGASGNGGNGGDGLVIVITYT